MIAAQRVHFIGVGGIGMSALARVLMESGVYVSGSDVSPSDLALDLKSKGASIHTGHQPEYIEQAELVVVSSAIPDDNSELVEAKRRNVPVTKRAQLLGELMSQRVGVAVAGTHGKTTTTSLITYLLNERGLDPTFLIGGEAIDLGGNAALGQGPHLVAEADEFDNSFLQLRPFLAVITNIEPEHLDHFGDFDTEIEAFSRFIGQVKAEGHIIACADDSTVLELVQRQSHAASVHLYGQSEDASWQASQIEPDGRGGHLFSISHKGDDLGTFHTPLVGIHNVLNATAAMAAAHTLGVEIESIRTSLTRFKGIKRRFDVQGEVNGIIVIDDYAHHPTEISVTLTAAKARYPNRRIVAVFQPHLYSRTKNLLDGFARCFDQADVVIISDIFASRERDDLGISSQNLVDALKHPQGRYGGNLTETAKLTIEILQAGDILLALGAGDITRLSQAVLEALKQ